MLVGSVDAEALTANFVIPAKVGIYLQVYRLTQPGCFASLLRVT
jgi:hypothetical protein